MKLSLDFETTGLDSNNQNTNPIVHMNLTFHNDPGHGWLAVKRTTLEAWGLVDKISEYSYQSKTGKTVYLEEDGDMATFVNHAESLGINISHKPSYQERSPVRSYPRFQK